MRVLLVGSGAREHAMAWKLARSKGLTELLLWPGNPAMAKVAGFLDVPADIPYDALGRHLLDKSVDLVVVGPEKPLSEGLADTLTKMGLPVFGPCRAAAQLESSKAFAKEIMAEGNVPTAAFQLTRSREECRKVALAMFQRTGATVLKASGLAAGKGVFVCRSRADIDDGLEHLYSPQMREASEVVVVEEILVGRECSHFSFVGPGAFVPLGFAVDFKRLRDGDIGPNTGGMGAYAPVPWLPATAGDEVVSRIVRPMLEALQRRGIEYTGCLYTGIMWNAKGPVVVEFNVRLGDPEAQILAVHDDRDWLGLIIDCLGLAKTSERAAAALRTIHTHATPPAATPKYTAGAVMASEGYPFGGVPETPASLPLDLFSGKDHASCRLFGAAVKPADNRHVQTGSGRVLTVVAQGDDFETARRKVYEGVEQVKKHWPSAHFRRDIAANTN